MKALLVLLQYGISTERVLSDYGAIKAGPYYCRVLVPVQFCVYPNFLLNFPLHSPMKSMPSKNASSSSRAITRASASQAEGGWMYDVAHQVLVLMYMNQI